MQRQHHAVELEYKLFRVTIGAQMPGIDRLPGGGLHLPLPAAVDRDHAVTHRTFSVVELDRAGDEYAAIRDFHRAHPVQPVVEHRAQARQTARLFQRRPEHLVHEAPRVFVDQRDLQLLA